MRKWVGGQAARRRFQQRGTGCLPKVLTCPRLGTRKGHTAAQPSAAQRSAAQQRTLLNPLLHQRLLGAPVALLHALPPQRLLVLGGGAHLGGRAGGVREESGFPRGRSMLLHWAGPGFLPAPASIQHTQPVAQPAGQPRPPAQPSPPPTRLANSKGCPASRASASISLTRSTPPVARMHSMKQASK